MQRNYRHGTADTGQTASTLAIVMSMMGGALLLLTLLLGVLWWNAFGKYRDVGPPYLCQGNFSLNQPIANYVCGPPSEVVEAQESATRYGTTALVTGLSSAGLLTGATILGRRGRR